MKGSTRFHHANHATGKNRAAINIFFDFNWCRLDLYPMAQRGAAVARAGADEAVIRVLLEAVRDPSCGAAKREDRGGQSTREAEHPGAYGQVEIEIRAQPFALPDRFLDLEGRVEHPLAPAARSRSRDLLEQRGARIAGGIYGMAEAGRQQMFLVEVSQKLVEMSTRLELREHRFDTVACAAVDRSGERAERGEHRGVKVGAGARDDACGKG